MRLLIVGLDGPWRGAPSRSDVDAGRHGGSGTKRQSAADEPELTASADVACDLSDETNPTLNLNAKADQNRTGAAEDDSSGPDSGGFD